MWWAFPFVGVPINVPTLITTKADIPAIHLLLEVLKIGILVP